MKDANFSECKPSAEMVSYMYDELSPAARSSFEQHLVDCTECTDEFAAISSARFEVYDWRKIEFDPLETPRFELPFEETAGVSWADKIRSVFAQGWAVPTVSFAALAIVAVVAAGLIWRQGDNGQIVSRNPGSEATVTPAKDEIASPTMIDAPEKTVVAAKEPTTGASQSKPSAPKRSQAQSARTRRVRPVEAKQTTARNLQPKFPTLSDYPDDEDTSLRLAELLEDIGSR